MTRLRAGLGVLVLSAWVVGGGGCASLGASVPRGGKPAMSDVQFRLRDFRLQNGMRILVEEDHASPLVGVVAVVGVGSSGDPQGREGLAHLLEHLAFRSRPGGGPSAADSLAGRTAAELLARELHDRLRSELGASYGFGGSARGEPGEVQRLDWSGSIENPRLALGLSVLADRRAMLETQGLTDAALERARWAVARQLTVALDTTTEVTAALTRRALARRPTTNLESDFETLAGLGKDQVLSTWRQCKGSMVLSLVGDEAVIRDALDQAGL